MRRPPVAGIQADCSDNDQTDQSLAAFIFLKALSSVPIFGSTLNWLKMGVSGWALANDLLIPFWCKHCRHCRRLSHVGGKLAARKRLLDGYRAMVTSGVWEEVGRVAYPVD